MIAAKIKHDELIEKDAVACAENFAERMRQKVVSPKHKFKRTDRIHLQTRYPEFREESEEEKNKATQLDASLDKVAKKGYDQELLEKLRRFLEFWRRIFKKKSPTGQIPIQGKSNKEL
jgi:hypothetical protein